MKKCLLWALCAALLLLLPATVLAEADTPMRGVYDGDTYHNAYTGLTFDIPDGFVRLEDDAMAELFGVAVDQLAERGTPIDKEAITASVIYDTFVVNGTTGDNISILLEKPEGNIVNEDMYIILLKMQLNTVMPNLSFEETVDAELSGVPFRMAEGTDGNGMVQRYYMHMRDDMMCQVILTVTGKGTQTADEIMASFR